jgi:glucose/mannose-6-phosphate isomerase
MLDDLKYIHQKDAQDALGVAEKQANQLLLNLELTPAPKSDHVYNVVLAGMGGSALAAVIAQTWLKLPEPFEIVRGYEAPGYLDKDSLFIASSYSGNTEETLAALEQAEKQNAQIAVMASGGKLAEIAQTKGYPLALLPGGLQPRHATLASLKALATILDGFRVTKSSADELTAVSEFLKAASASWLPTVPASQNQAKKIAQELMGKSAVIYSGPKLFPAAYKWKININENAKQVAWCNQLPEFNHNEMMGWTEQPVQKPYGVIEIRSNLEDPRIQKRFEITEKVLSGKRPSPLIIQPEGQSLLEQLLWAITLGDFVSLYLALLNNLNPTPVELIEKFKKALEQ